MIEVVVALIITLGGVLVAWIGRLSSKIGTPNGQGNVVEMLQKILAGQTDQDSRLAHHDTQLADHGARITALEQRGTQ